MNNFSFTRVGLLIRHKIFSDIRNYRNQLIGIFLCIFLCMFFIFYNVDIFSLNATDKAAALSISIPTLYFAGGVLSLFYTSLTFNSLNSKGKRISTLMLPATNLEKFISFLTVSVVFYHIAFLVLLPVADLANFLFFVIMKGSSVFFSPYFFEVMGECSPSMLFLLFLALLSQISTYVLGSACFRRQPFILTTLCEWVLSIVILIVSSISLGYIGENLPLHMIDFGFLDKLSENQLIFGLKSILALVMILWISFCLVISYRMFCRASVITNKRFGF